MATRIGPFRSHSGEMRRSGRAVRLLGRACTGPSWSPTETIPRTAWPTGSGQLYCGFAEKDPNASPPIRQALSEAFAGCPVDYRFEVHPGAEHGYALPDRDIHDNAPPTGTGS